MRIAQHTRKAEREREREKERERDQAEPLLQTVTGGAEFHLEFWFCSSLARGERRVGARGRDNWSAGL